MVSAKGSKRFKLSLKKKLNKVTSNEVFDDDSPNGNNESEKFEKSILGTLENLGATCFANSVLYILRFTPDLRHRIHHLVDDIQNKNTLGKTATPSESVIMKIHQVFTKLYKQEVGRGDANDESFAPNDLIDIIR